MSVSQSSNLPYSVSDSAKTFDTVEMDLDAARAFLPLKPGWCHGDQTLEDAATLIALAQLKKDGNILEIGTSAGEGAAALLYGCREGSGTLTGIDLAEQVYYDKSHKVGDVVPEALPEMQARYTIFSGVASEHVLTMDMKFDLVHIDAAHSHPWATFDMLSAMTQVNDGAIFAFHDANYTAALSQAAYYLSRIMSGQGRFIGNHFAFVYKKEMGAELVEAILDILDLPWQTSLPPENLVALHAALSRAFPDVEVMRIMSKLLEKNAEYLANAHIHEALNKGLWQRELERRRLLAERKDS
ncbi:class I SAM-dependent methyltransferase [Mameliella sediminis]|uniref:class I SAM-dependent methyltransferase n=1 Tax=Mameliella sediminis TaxID=2836866 RepID=UPI001C461EE1|nr:class I SAM-dependent methyltransferase [Mameliella sediminis]MBY6117294.1 class I SAM-dependent methyltransferase [Antarctobacter heliothermus]MBY6147162.1 class I SAM-dependent methyltransferase [Mameliella alba]MBV7397359.1 class I SAM-dependent methyltransferase [Mameliella sediminis]MBY6172529.1 class I SAM-dependent methyltransferase [Mameliella alba]MCA0957201.1 class I SAM-dependent methyltransferase [Mameliella alba]